MVENCNPQENDNLLEGELLLVHHCQCEVRVIWSQDAESFIATAKDLEGLEGLGSSYTDAVCDLELAMGLHTALISEEELDALERSPELLVEARDSES